MKKQVIAFGILLLMTASILPVAAAIEDEVPWAHILDNEFEADIKPTNPGKPPKDDPNPQPTEFTPWGVDRIDADLVTPTGLTGEGIDVAVLDTGIDKNHPDLYVKGGVNFVPKGLKVDASKWDDDNGHGTHVAGTIAALDNTIGVIGVAPGVNLWAVKVLDRRGSGSLTWVINGIYWAINNNMDVISMSLSAGLPYSDLEKACLAAERAGIVVVAAAGNDGSYVKWPAAYDTVMAISATGMTGSIDYVASFSNFGTEINVSAPGVGIPSTWKDGGYNTISGTSMACPHVSGVAALVLASSIDAIYDYNDNGLWEPIEVKDKIEGTAESMGSTNYFGSGIVDAYSATS